MRISMKAIISGAKGNLGSHIISNAEFETFSLGRSNWDELSSAELSSDDVFVHCAYDLKNTLKEKPDEVIDSNVLSTMRALRLCKEKSLGKFIFISSCSVYGYSSKSNEDTPCAPVTVNGLSKYLCEKVVQEFCTANEIDYLILRVFNTYGGDDQFSVVSKMIKASKNNSSIILNNKGMAERDYIHIDDVAKIICHYCTNKSKYNVLNVGTGKTLRIIDILEAIEKKFGTLKKDERVNNNEVEYSRARVSRLEEEIQLDYKNLFDYIESL